MTETATPASAPLLVRGEEAEELGLGPATMRLIADGDTPGGVSISRTRMRAGMEGAPPHFHSAAAEMFYVLDGGLHVLLGEDVATVGAGDYLVVPAYTTHAFAAAADTGVDMLFLMPQVVRFDFFRLGARIAQGRAEPAELSHTQERFDNHWQRSEAWERFLSEVHVTGGLLRGGDSDAPG